MYDDIEKVVVDPSDLHTVLWAFYKAEPLHSQAEFRAADRLNAALDRVGWAYDPRDPPIEKS